MLLTGATGSSASPLRAIAGENGAAGQVIIATGSGLWELANAGISATSRAYGLLLSPMVLGAEGQAVNSGQLELATAQWDAITGGSGGLTPGSDYFLSDTTDGNITLAPPGTAILVGRSITSTRMAVQLGTSGSGGDFDENRIAIDENFEVVVDENFNVALSEVV